jgi:DNA replication protein DnaC
MAPNEGELAKIENCDLLIIDDFGLQTINNEKQLVLMDLIEDRHNKKSTLFCSPLIRKKRS